MSGLLLPALAVIVGVLLALVPVAWAGGAWLASRGTLGLCGLGTVVSFVAMVSGAHPPVLEIPIGLPGSGILVALDGLSSFFLVLLFGTGAAVSGAAVAPAYLADPTAPLRTLLVGALAATVIAADGFSVVLGFEATALAVAGLVLGGIENFRPAARLIGGGVLAGLCLVAAMALLAPLQAWGLDLSFAGMRAHPPEGFRATSMFMLTLLAVAGLAGTSRGQRATSGPVGALLCGGIGAPYLLARVVFDLGGPGQPGWWGAVLVVLGAGGALLAAIAAFRAADLPAVATAASMVPRGLASLAMGLALAARAADLAPLAALAVGAALLLTVAQALGGTTLALAVSAAATGAGTRRLDKLGGLVRGMPLTTVGVLAGAASFAALPPSAGFAAVWTLLQALISTARAGGLGWQMLATVATLATAGAVTLSVLAAVRLVGIAFLGRPRTPRTAAAQEVPVPTRAATLALAVTTLAVGVFPGGVLTLAAPAFRSLLGVDMADRVGWLSMTPAPEAPGLRAAALTVLLLAAIVAALWGQKLRAAVGHRAGAAWEGGAPPPPLWLPFGDPATQIGPAGFADPAGTLLAAAIPRVARRARATLRKLRTLGGWTDALLQPSLRTTLVALLIAATALLVVALAVQA